MSGRKGMIRPNTEFTLCWDCKNAVYQRCEWTEKFEPVPGWQAVHRQVSKTYFPYDSYRVLYCPKFVRDADRGGQTPYPKEAKNEKPNCDKHCSSCSQRGVVEPLGAGRVDDGRGCLACETGWRQRVLDQPNRDVFDLAYVTLERAIEDWKALDYGRRAEVMVDKELVGRNEVVEFFFSKWFEILLAATMPYTPKQIRKLIRMPEDAREIIACAEGRI